MGHQIADLSRVEEDLQRAITTLYQTFAGYPLQEVIEGCEHCVPLADQTRLRTTPLRALTVQDLHRFLISNCTLTWGGAVELKHFLPRLCELIALHAPDERQRLSPEILGGGLRRHGYAAWPRLEQQAIASFGQAWCRQDLATLPHELYALNHQAATVLCSLGQFTDDLAPTLAIWQQTPTLSALAHLIVLVHDWVVAPNLPPTAELVWDEEAWEASGEFDFSLRSAAHKLPFSGFWEERKPQLAQVVTWINAPSTARWALELNESLRTSEPGAYQRWRETPSAYVIENALAWFELLGDRSLA